MRRSVDDFTVDVVARDRRNLCGSRTLAGYPVADGDAGRRDSAFLDSERRSRVAADSGRRTEGWALRVRIAVRISPYRLGVRIYYAIDKVICRTRHNVIHLDI